MEAWWAEELDGFQLGHARREKRAVAVLEKLAANPAASLPQAIGRGRI